MSCPEEEWKPVVGFEHYWVSNRGQVKSTQKWRDGKCASLKVVEVPEDAEWEIDEYDGNEHVAEKHRTWG